MSDKFRLVFACDHTALHLKDVLVRHARAAGHVAEDIGAHTTESVNYATFGHEAARLVAEGKFERGVVLCGSGIGISIAANKTSGARCVVCSEPYSAAFAVRHNNANLLAMGARVVGEGLAVLIFDSWIHARYEGGRHEERVHFLSKLDGSL